MSDLNFKPSISVSLAGDKSAAVPALDDAAKAASSARESAAARERGRPTPPQSLLS